MTKPTTDYLLLFRGTNWQKGKSPEELEKTLSAFMNWFEEIKAEGKMKGANPLAMEGKLVTGQGGRTVIDGPFAESKEAIGGYFHIVVQDEAEAIAIAQRCPLLAHGSTVEVRPIAGECAAASDLRKVQAGELAHA